MAGNVWEWTGSLFLRYPNSVSAAPEDPTTLENRALRGGSWSDDSRTARAAYRVGSRPGNFLKSLGFRLVRAAPNS